MQHAGLKSLADKVLERNSAAQQICNTAGKKCCIGPVLQQAHATAIGRVATAQQPPAVRDRAAELTDDCERRFGQPHARLFPFLGRRVQTPAGQGRLIQIFTERVAVDCGDVGPDGTGKVRFFQPSEIEALQ